MLQLLVVKKKSATGKVREVNPKVPATVTACSGKAKHTHGLGIAKYHYLGSCQQHFGGIAAFLYFPDVLPM